MFLTKRCILCQSTASSSSVADLIIAAEVRHCCFRLSLLVLTTGWRLSTAAAAVAAAAATRCSVRYL
eukprot:2718-Heterococcus_DN1.PRE.1